MVRPAAIVLDIGETVVSDERVYAARARRWNVPVHTAAAVIGALRATADPRSASVVLNGRPNGDPLGSGADAAAEMYVPISRRHLYPDVTATLDALRRAGCWIGLAGNQPAGIADDLRALRLAVDAVATSAEWGLAKPDPSYFAKVIEWTGHRPDQIIHVGDQVESDVVAAHNAGLNAVHVVRGPWGHLDAADIRIASHAVAQIGTLLELEAIVRAFADDADTLGGQS